ncbi:MAG: radical SAM protein [Clostridiales bacterium]|nr:radical SAM protein [Clostridiales bacterium]
MHRVRAEENALLLWNGALARTAYISGEELHALRAWADGEDNGFSERLKGLGIISDAAKATIREAIAKAAKQKAPANSFCAPESIHIELTSRCPLNCPQCYKEQAKTDLAFAVLLDAIRQADEMHVFQIALGGGEPLVYPHLLAAVAEISGRGMGVSITTSGVGLTRAFLSELRNAGLHHMQFSLNGSSEEIHSRSRDGYAHTINALRLAGEAGISFGINWVARMDNIDDFPALTEKAKGLHANNINILRYKPSAKECYAAICLSADKQLFLEDAVKSTVGISIKVDSAFTNLLCHVNGRTSFFSGCGAGRRFLAMDADGYYRPCSHIPLKERANSLKELWYTSANLAAFRFAGDKIKEPCASCGFLNGCLGCRAVMLGRTGDFYAGDISCPFQTQNRRACI